MQLLLALPPSQCIAIPFQTHHQQLRKNNSNGVLTRQNKANDEEHLHQLDNTSAANTTQLNRKT